jgi:hypothetical protein
MIDNVHRPRVIKIAESEKMNAARKIRPNFVYNRFDLIYGDSFDLYELTEYDRTSYIPVHVKGRHAYIGAWLSEIPPHSFRKFIGFVFDHYRKVHKVILRYSLNYHEGLKTTNHWKVNLEKNKERIYGRRSHGIKINISRINRDFSGYKINKYSISEIPDRIIIKYFEFKKIAYGADYRMSPEEYLRTYFVTSAYCLLINNVEESILFICELDDIVYLENITYNKNFAQYGPGVVLYDYLLKDLICNGKKVLYLGDGNQEYKRRFCGENQLAFDGVIGRYPIIDNAKRFVKGAIKHLALKLNLTGILSYIIVFPGKDKFNF